MAASGLGAAEASAGASASTVLLAASDLGAAGASAGAVLLTVSDFGAAGASVDDLSFLRNLFDNELKRLYSFISITCTPTEPARNTKAMTMTIK